MPLAQAEERKSQVYIIKWKFKDLEEISGTFILVRVFITPQFYNSETKLVSSIRLISKI